MLEGILVGTIDASLLRKAMQSCSGVDTPYVCAGFNAKFDKAWDREPTGNPEVGVKSRSKGG